MPYDPGDPKYERVRQVMRQHSQAHLIRTLRTDNFSLLREQAALVLRGFAGGEVEDALCEALMDPDMRVRHAAAETLLNTGRERGLRRLAEVAEHLDWVVLIRRLVSQTETDPTDFRPEDWLWPRSLSRVGGPALSALCDELGRPHPETRGIVQAALASIGEPAVEPLCRALENPNGELRQAAAEVMGDIGSPRTIEALRKYVETADWTVALSAAMSLARSGPPAYETLKELLTSRNAQVRELTTAALCLSPHPSGREALQALGPTALPALSEVLSQGSEAVRTQAALALGWLGLREALPALRARLPRLGVGGERDRSVVAAIREAIRRIESTTHETDGLPRAARDREVDPSGRPRAAGDGGFPRGSEE